MDNNYNVENYSNNISETHLDNTSNNIPANLPNNKKSHSKRFKFPKWFNSSELFKNIISVLMSLPTLITASAAFLFPLIITITISFTSYSVSQPPKFAGLSNYKFLFGDADFYHALSNTLLLNVLTCIIVGGISLFLARLYQSFSRIAKTCILAALNMLSLFTLVGGLSNILSPLSENNFFPILLLFTCLSILGPVMTVTMFIPTIKTPANTSTIHTNELSANNTPKGFKKLFYRIFPSAFASKVYTAFILPLILGIFSLSNGMYSTNAGMTNTLINYIKEYEQFRFDISFAYAAKIILILYIILFILVIILVIFTIMGIIAKFNKLKRNISGGTNSTIIKMAGSTLLFLILSGIVLCFLLAYLNGIGFDHSNISQDLKVGSIAQKLLNMLWIPLIPSLSLALISIAFTYGFSRMSKKKKINFSIIFTVCLLSVILAQDGALSLVFYYTKPYIIKAFFTIYTSFAPFISIAYLTAVMRKTQNSHKKISIQLLLNSIPVILFGYISSIITTYFMLSFNPSSTKVGYTVWDSLFGFRNSDKIYFASIFMMLLFIVLTAISVVIFFPKDKNISPLQTTTQLGKH